MFGGTAAATAIPPGGKPKRCFIMTVREHNVALTRATVRLSVKIIWGFTVKLTPVFAAVTVNENRPLTTGLVLTCSISRQSSGNVLLLE